MTTFEAAKPRVARGSAAIPYRKAKGKKRESFIRRQIQDWAIRFLASIAIMIAGGPVFLVNKPFALGLVLLGGFFAFLSAVVIFFFGTIEMTIQYLKRKFKRINKRPAK
ncbi:MAG TPA: hypothetical protein VG753_03450 [Candidatus Paceibacterota bacterium]|nr:hypothetical protein [Candidatus Paceibacterota bacterium]